MSIVANRAVVEIAKGYIAKEDVGHNRDAFELLFRAVSDTNALWVVWEGVCVLVNRGPDWGRVIGSASLMSRLAERAARDCFSGLTATDITEAVGPAKDSDSVAHLDDQLSAQIEQELDSSFTTLVLLSKATQTLHAQSLPATVIGQRAQLWTDVPNSNTKYQYDSVAVGAKSVVRYVKEAGTTDAVNLTPTQQIRLHLTEIGRKRRRLDYDEMTQPLFNAAIRDAGYSWNRRVEMFRDVLAKATSSFCDREGAFLAFPTILRHMHAGTVDEYIDKLPNLLPNLLPPCEKTQFLEYHPITRLDLIKDDLSAVSDRVEFSSDGSHWHVGHGATLAADVWAAVCSLAINDNTKPVFEATGDQPSAPANSSSLACKMVQIVMVDDDSISHRPAEQSYTLKAVTDSSTIVKLTVLNTGEQYRLLTGEAFRVELPPNGSWLRILVDTEPPNAEQPPATFRFRTSALSADQFVISPVCVGIESEYGVFRDGTNAYSNALPGFRRREMPLDLLYAPSILPRITTEDVASALASNFEGFIAVSEEDSRRVAYAAKLLDPEESPPGLDASQISSAVKTTGPAALYTPKMAWVRSHDGVATLCKVHYNNRQRFVPTPLRDLAFEYVRDAIRDAVDSRDTELLEKAFAEFDRNINLYDGALAAAAELIVATSRSTVYHDAKAAQESSRCLRVVVGQVVAAVAN